MLGASLGGGAPRTRPRGTEPGEHETRQADQKRGDPVLDVVVVRPCFMAGKPGRQRLGRLGPVDDCERNQRESNHNGEPDEQTVALHDRAA
jgi:hypothetical protein